MRFVFIFGLIIFILETHANTCDPKKYLLGDSQSNDPRSAEFNELLRTVVDIDFFNLYLRAEREGAIEPGFAAGPFFIPAKAPEVLGAREYSQRRDQALEKLDPSKWGAPELGEWKRGQTSVSGWIHNIMKRGFAVGKWDAEKLREFITPDYIKSLNGKQAVTIALRIIDIWGAKVIVEPGEKFVLELAIEIANHPGVSPHQRYLLGMMMRFEILSQSNIWEEQIRFKDEEDYVPAMFKTLESLDIPGELGLTSR